MWDLVLRKVVARAVQGGARVVGRLVTANTVTVIAFLCGLAAAGFTAAGWQKAGVASWGANRLLDGLDGAVARHCKQQSDFGGFLDIVSDFVVYALIPAALQPSCLPLLFAAYVFNCVSLFKLSAVLEDREKASESTSVRMPPALIEGAETILAYTAALLLPEYSVVPMQETIFSVFAGLVILGPLHRLMWAYTHIR